MGIAIALDSSGVPVRVDVRSPGDLRLVRVRAVEQQVAGITDFAFDLKACDEILFVVGHVVSLDEDLFAGRTDLSTWVLEEEYSTGGETFRVSSIELDMEVAAGTRLGSAGGVPERGGLDYGMWDRTRALQRPPTRSGGGTTGTCTQ